MFERLVVRLQSLFRRTRVDQELDEEMQFHLDRDIARNIARGMSDTEAYFAAHRSFGNVYVTSSTPSTRDSRSSVSSRWRSISPTY